MNLNFMGSVVSIVRAWYKLCSSNLQLFSSQRFIVSDKRKYNKLVMKGTKRSCLSSWVRWTTNLLIPSPRLQSYHHEVTVVLELIVLVTKRTRNLKLSSGLWNLALFSTARRDTPTVTSTTNERCVALLRSTTSPTLVPATPAGISTGLQTSHLATSHPKRRLGLDMLLVLLSFW